MSVTSDFENRTGLAVPGATTKACSYCKCSCDDLFAPFDSGEATLCSDCQMEAENEIAEQDVMDSLQDYPYY